MIQASPSNPRDRASHTDSRRTLQSSSAREGGAHHEVDVGNVAASSGPRGSSWTKTAIFKGMYRSGLAGAFGKVVHPPGAIVLMYHSIAAPAESAWIDPASSMPVSVFERQMRFLSRHRRVVSMSTLVAAMERDEPIPAGTVVLTFDDGYLDNLRNAAPILRSHGLPATLYVPTGLVDRAEAQWVDRLHVLLRVRTVDAVSLRGGQQVNLGDPRQLAEFKNAAARQLLVADRETRARIIQGLGERLGSSAEPPRLTMSWKDVREWARIPGLEVGVHTVEHVDVTSCTTESADAEIRGSMARGAEELGRQPEHFSFPYGRSTPETRALIRAAGLRSAVASGPDPRVRPGGPVDWIPRIAAPRSSTLFRFYTSAAYPDLPRKLIGRV